MHRRPRIYEYGSEKGMHDLLLLKENPLDRVNSQRLEANNQVWGTDLKRIYSKEQLKE